MHLYLSTRRDEWIHWCVYIYIYVCIYINVYIIRQWRTNNGPLYFHGDAIPERVELHGKERKIAAGGVKHDTPPKSILIEFVYFYLFFYIVLFNLKYNYIHIYEGDCPRRPRKSERKIS